MVTLPEIESYSTDTKESLSKYSPIFSHYLNHLKRDSSCFEDQLRKNKHKHWLKCALATFSDKVSPEEVCLYWSQETEKLLKSAWQHVQLPEDDVCLLLYGKLGSFELNLSSDVDVVFVKSNQTNQPDIQTKVKKFIQLLSSNTPFGFAYRVDLNLRPGGDNSPLVPNKNHFFNFYDEFLEAWHRLSFIRVRPLFIGSELAEDLTSYCKKRCFPKRMDFSVLEEIKSVRSKIAFQWRRSQEPFDIKLHPGGIRDIELYIHSLQVIYGGRNPSLRAAKISQAMRSLAKMGALKQDEMDFLLNFYWRLRKIENLIHIKEDQHTYLLQKNFFQELAQFQITEEEVQRGFEKAEQIIGGFFVRQEPQTTDPQVPSAELSQGSRKAIAEIRGLKSASIKKQGIEKLKEDILNTYVNKAKEIAIDEELAIQIFRDFIFSIKSKTSIFYLLHRHKELLENLAWLFSISPYVGQILTRRPELIDSFALGQVVIDDKEDIEALWESLVDYKLLGQLMGIIELFKNPHSDKYFQHLSEQADLIVRSLIEFQCRELKAEPLDVLTMGKWSGKELGVRSDLDFVFLSNNDPTAAQIKVARRMITLLTTRSNAGRLYDIDLRLKPNENAGPLILHRPAFIEFIKNQAEPWQKQAYLRSRLCGQSEFFLKDHFDFLRLNSSQIDELDSIHQKLLTPSTAIAIDIKKAPGGLLQTEFTVQKKILSADGVPHQTTTTSLIDLLDTDNEIKERLKKNYRFLRRLEQIFQITNDSSSTKVGAKSNNLGRVSKMLGVENVFARLQAVVSEQQQLFKELDLNH